MLRDLRFSFRALFVSISIMAVALGICSSIVESRRSWNQAIVSEIRDTLPTTVGARGLVLHLDFDAPERVCDNTMEAAWRLRGLRHIDLTGTNVTAKGLRTLANNPTLDYVECDFDRFTSAEMTALDSEHPEVFVWGK